MSRWTLEELLHSLSVKLEAGAIDPEDVEWMVNVLFTLNEALYDENGDRKDEIEEVHLADLDLELNKWCLN